MDYFEYTSEEWAEIERAAQRVRLGPLTDFIRARLRDAADEYLLSCKYDQWLKDFQSACDANWKNIGRLSAELADQLTEADARAANPAHQGLRKKLAKLHDYASMLTSEPRTYSRPREEYYHDILSVWADQLGGQIRLSRDGRTNKLRGPLVSFVQAVVSPVLGSEAPALESIADIINRERTRRLTVGDTYHLAVRN